MDLQSAPEDRPPSSSSSSLAVLPESPGAKGSRICGILSILLALTFVGFPAGLVLGIVALVKHGRSRRRALESSGAYAYPGSTGLVVGVVGLSLSVLAVPAGGVVAAVAVPMYLMKRDQHRGDALEAQMRVVEARGKEILGVMEQNQGAGAVAPQDLIQAMVQDPVLSRLKSTWDPGLPLLELGEKPSRKGVIALSVSDSEQDDGSLWGVIRLEARYAVLDEEKQVLSEIPVREWVREMAEHGAEGAQGTAQEDGEPVPDAAPLSEP